MGMKKDDLERSSSIVVLKCLIRKPRSMDPYQ